MYGILTTTDDSYQIKYLKLIREIKIYVYLKKGLYSLRIFSMLVI